MGPQPSQQLALPQPSQQLALNQPTQQLKQPSAWQQLSLPQPSKQLALPQPPQQPASAQPHQQLSLPPPQALALEYNPRGEIRKNIEIREIDRKRIILENDMKRLQRRNDKFIQEGKGLRELYQKLCVCKDEKFQKIVLGLSDREIFRICQCVYSYLEELKVKNDDGFNEYIKLDTNIKHHMCNVVYGDNSMKECRKFLGGDENGND